MKIVIIGILLLSSVLWAQGHRHHGSHQHGSGKIGIAFEGASGKIDLKIPSESVFGFEHEAKSAKQKAAQKAGLESLEKKIGLLVVFDPNLQCQISPDKVEVLKAKRSSHSDAVAAYTIKCAKSPLGSAIIFNFQREFPKLKDVDVEVVADNLQKSIEVKESGARLELK